MLTKLQQLNDQRAGYQRVESTLTCECGAPVRERVAQYFDSKEEQKRGKVFVHCGPCSIPCS